MYLIYWRPGVFCCSVKNQDKTQFSWFSRGFGIWSYLDIPNIYPTGTGQKLNISYFTTKNYSLQCKRYTVLQKMITVYTTHTIVNRPHRIIFIDSIKTMLIKLSQKYCFRFNFGFMSNRDMWSRSGRDSQQTSAAIFPYPTSRHPLTSICRQRREKL